MRFELRDEGGAQHLVLPDCTLFGWLGVQGLELRVPEREGAAPLDLSDLGRLQRLRTEVQSGQLSLRQEDIDTYVAGSGATLADLGVDELVLRACDGYLGLSARVRESALVADLSARLYLTADEDRLRISCAQPRLYGHLDTAAPIIAHRLMGALLRIGKDTYTEVLGLGDMVLRPLHATLFRTLPAAGWRIPKLKGLRIAAVHIDPSGVEISFARLGGRAHTDSGLSQAATTLCEALERFRDTDNLLLAGDDKGALRGYRGELAARGPEQPFLVGRILSIASTRREYFMDGLELARQVLGRWPDFAPAHAALASIAVAQGDIESAAARYRELSQASATVGDDESTVRAALAGARLLRQFAPDESTKLYELVLDHRPGHAEASEALADRYRDEERWLDLVRLIRVRLGATEDPLRQARDHARLAEVLADHLDEPEEAAAELAIACRLDAGIPTVYENLARVHLSLGELEAALQALETAIKIYESRQDLRAQLRCLLRGGQACLDEASYSDAAAWFGRALELSAGDSAAMRGAARAASGLQQYADAAGLWRELFDAGIEAPTVQGHYACELGRNLLASGQRDEARAPLERAAKTGDARTRAEAHALLAPMILADDHRDEAIEHYESAIESLLSDGDDNGDLALAGRASLDPAERAAELCVELATLLREVARADEALEASRRAFELAAPDSLTRKRAARALLDASDPSEGELEWIDELVSGNEDRDECAMLSVRRAVVLAARDDAQAALGVIAKTLEGELGDEAKSAALELQAELLATVGDNLARANVLEQRAALSGSNTQRAHAFVESAEGWLAAQDYARSKGAARVAVQALGHAEDEVSARLARRAQQTLGECAWKTRRWDEVDEAYQALLGPLLDGAELEIEDADQLLVRWGTAMEKEGKIDDAIRVFEHVVSHSESEALRAVSSRFLGDLYEQQGTLIKAAEAMERYASSDAVDFTDSARADAWFRVGALCRRDDALSELAKNYLDRALQISRDHLPALDALEQIARREEDHERQAVILGRKVAAIGRHPKRQRGLLTRLAELQENELGRVDVARETYRRVLDIDPSYRPALRFMAADAQRRGDFPGAAEYFYQLARPLDSDDELGLSREELDEYQQAALFELAQVTESRAGEASDDIIALLEERARGLEDDRLFRALEASYRRADKQVALADILGRRASIVDASTALPLDLERIELLATKLSDRGAALMALTRGLERNPGNAGLVAWERKLGEDEAAVEDEESQALDTDESTVEELWQEVEDCLREGDRDCACKLLPLIASRERSAGNRAGEHKAVRRLADLLLERGEDRPLVVGLYRRALELDPNDAVAANLVALAEEKQGNSSAAEPVEAKEPAPSDSAAELSDEELDLEARYERAVEASRAAPTNLGLIRHCAELAEARDRPSETALWLETLAEKLAAGIGSNYRGEHLGDILLKIADLYYDRLGLIDQARKAMRRAAEAFGEGSRRTAALRLLASEAMSAGSHVDAIAAFEAIGIDKLGAADQLSAAKLYQRLGREQDAINVLEQARGSGSLSDESSVLLLQLHRQRTRKRDLAQSLEGGAAGAERSVATTRLIEALRIYEESLHDEESAARIRERLAEVDPGSKKSPSESSPHQLEAAARAAADSGLRGAADLLALSLRDRCRTLATLGKGLDAECEQLLDQLRGLARNQRTGASQEVESLVAALLAAAGVEEDPGKAALLLREAAKNQRRRLHDRRGAADALARALVLSPADQDLFSELDEALREANDYAQLASAYELHLAALDGPERARPLLELGRIYLNVFEEEERAQQYFKEAVEADAAMGHSLSSELARLKARSDSPAERPDADLESELSRAEGLVAQGKHEEGISAYERIALIFPRERRPLDALKELYETSGHYDALLQVLETLVELSPSASERARLYFQCAQIARNELRDERRLYHYLKEAAAHEPKSALYANALRTIAMARGEWALAAELTYREIAASSEDQERGALYLELALIFDEKLLDPQQAVANYEQALRIDPEIPAAPRPLARLYELDGRYEEASLMYEQAAARSPSSADQGRLLRHAAINAERANLADEARRLYGLVAATGYDRDGRAALAAIDRIDGGEGSEDQVQRVARSSRPTSAPLSEEDTARRDALREKLNIAAAEGNREAVERLAGDLLEVTKGDLSTLDAMRERAREKEDWVTSASLLRARVNTTEDASERAHLLYELGCAYQHDLEDLSAAVGAFQQAIGQDPEQVAAKEALADIHYQQREWPKAYKIYMELDPDAVSLPPEVFHLRRGECAELLGHEEQAFDAICRASELAPQSSIVLEALIRTAQRVDKSHVAREAQERFLTEIGADDIHALLKARVQLAQMSERSGDLKSAIRHYQEVLVDDPGNGQALASLAKIRLSQGRSHEAAAFLRSLLRVTPDLGARAELLYQLGELRRDDDEQDEATEHYLKAIDLDPSHVPTQRRLLDYFWSEGEFDAATEMTRDLIEGAALMEAESGLRLVHRAAISAALSGELGLCHHIGEALGSGDPSEIARVLRQTASCTKPPSAEELAKAARILCESTGDSIESVAKILGAQSLTSTMLQVLDILGAGE